MKIKQAAISILVFSSILFIFSYPNYYALVNTPAKTVYAGFAAWFDPWDINVYTAAIKWSQKQGFNFQNAYTTESHKPILVYPLYTLLGVMFREHNPHVIFSASTIFFGVVLLLSLYKVSSVFLKKKRDVLASVFLTSLGGGLGWIFYPKLLFPDIAVTPFTFNSTFQKPHEALAVSFYFLSLALFYMGVKKRHLFSIVFSTAFMSFVIPFYPYHLLSFYLICGYFAAVFALRKKEKYPIFYFLFIFSITIVLGLAYSSYLLSGSSFEAVLNPYLGTPNLFKVAVGYGVLLPLLIYQLFNKKRSSAWIFLNLWFFLSLFSAYFPLPFSRYYLRGLFFPASILAINSLGAVSKKIRVSRKILLFALLVLVPISSFFIAQQRIEYVNSGDIQWYFLLKEEKEALTYLDKNTQGGTGVLASYTMGNYIPAHTGNRVYFGHHYQTPNSKEKIKNLTRFYKNEYSEEEARQFLIKNNISYVVWGPDEKDITLKHSGEEQLKYTFLEKVYSNPKVTIFSYDENYLKTK